MDLSQLIASLIEILWLDLVLSGENAILLATATRALPTEQRRLAVNLGTILFILLRVALAYALMALVVLPGLGLAGAALLLWAALWTAMRGEHPSAPEARPRRVLAAALYGALAFDAPFALVNMTAVQAAAHGVKPLVMFGLALSIPLLALGSAPFIAGLRRPPLLWLSAALLGWVAGRMAASDALVLASAARQAMASFAPAVGALVGILLAFGFSRRGRFRRLQDK
jgi:YjbE family integral membrane protein